MPTEMKKDYSVKQWFGKNLAELLSEKILLIHKSFPKKAYIKFVADRVEDLPYSDRLQIHAEALGKFLPADYKEAVKILQGILGPENPHGTGMFKNYYWLLPVGKFVELYGLDEYKVSIKLIEEITKRSTGEYVIRPFIEKYPDKTMKQLQVWSKAKNFHLRRLASEGCRPKLPWAKKLDLYINEPEPVFRIIENLITDEERYVQKSVANNINDYLKVNERAAKKLIKKYQTNKNPNTKWIISHATRNLRKTKA